MDKKHHFMFLRNKYYKCTKQQGLATTKHVDTLTP